MGLMRIGRGGRHTPSPPSAWAVEVTRTESAPGFGLFGAAARVVSGCSAMLGPGRVSVPGSFVSCQFMHALQRCCRLVLHCERGLPVSGYLQLTERQCADYRRNRPLIWLCCSTGKEARKHFHQSSACSVNWH